MMKLALIAALAGSAAAFAPAQTGKASTALNAFESELGVQPRKLFGLPDSLYYVRGAV